MVTISDVKKHLNIDSSFTEDDSYIDQLINVSIEAIEHSINDKFENVLVGGEIPSTIKHSMLLLIGNLYLNREPVAFGNVNKIPHTLDLLISVNKNYK